MKSAEERAKELMPCWQPSIKKCRCPSCNLRPSIAQSLTEFAEERVQHALAQRDLEQVGEAISLGGKRISPHDFYKSPADYLREARSAALDEAISVVIVHEGGLCNCHDDPEKCHQFKIDEIRALKK